MDLTTAGEGEGTLPPPSRTEHHYRELFQAVDQGFCTIDVLFDGNDKATDYRFIEVNPAFVQQTGLSDAVGRRMRELVPAHEEEWYRVYGEVAVTGVPARFEQGAAALGRWYDVYAFRIGEASLRRVGILFRDVTDRRNAELALEAARRAADSANRAKDEFLAMLGHELRNPLAPMLTALQVMRLRGLQGREQDILERQVRHMARMVDDLLDISRVTRGQLQLQREHVELHAVVAAAMELTAPILEQRHHRVDVRVPLRGATVDADRARLAQVVANLLTNAAKYSFPGSRIIVAGERTRDIVRLSVKDEGIGLALDQLDVVFEPFVQHAQSIDRAAGGLGLGLAIVRNLVTAHGGRVRAESDGAQRGSEFIVELPAVEASATPAHNQPAVPAPASRRQKVLVVDDNEDAATTMRSGLEALGHDVEVAFDGPSALLRAATFAPTTVLLDIGLPIMDGYEVARQLTRRAGGSPIQVIALTGYGQDVDKARAKAAQFAHHLVKPVDLEVLRRLLDEAPPPHR